MSLSIVALGQYCETIKIDDALPNLKPLVKESVGQHVRRINQFIQLALIGAGRASQGLSDYDGVYYASGCGDVEVTVELMNGIYRDGLSPKPLSFVNSVSNAASYHVSKCLGLHGPSHFVTSRYSPFETALMMAALDVEREKVSAALVGAVDIVLPPLHEHCERIGLPGMQPVAEASHWLQLRKTLGDLPELAKLESLQHFCALGELLDVLAAYRGQDYSVAFGQYTDEAAQRDCLSACQLSRFIDEEAEATLSGHYESRSGELICHFINGGQDGLLLISGDRHDRYYLSVFSKADAE